MDAELVSVVVGAKVVRDGPLGYVIRATPFPEFPVIVPPDRFGIVAFPAVIVELVTPPT